MSKYRNEYKYLINSSQRAVLETVLSGTMEPDPHTDENGCYTIRSLYFDDINDNCLRENINGTNVRNKYRLRYYNNDLEYISLEKKGKENGMTSKLSRVISLDEAMALQNGHLNSEVVFPGMLLNGMQPKTIVSYDRKPFIYPAGNVRVTIDYNISSSVETGKFLSGDYAMRPVLDSSYSILEVKWDEVLPLHIKEMLMLSNLEWFAFSKYAYCRKYHL